MSTSRLAIALDQNFPQPILRCLNPYLDTVDLVPLEAIDARLGTLLDWQLLVALHHRSFHALVTNDYHMFYEPKVLMAAQRTRVTLIAVEALGDDPIRATGALLLDIPAIARAFLSHKAKVFHIRRTNPRPSSITDVLSERARRAGVDIKDLVRAERMSTLDLENPVV